MKYSYRNISICGELISLSPFNDREFELALLYLGIVYYIFSLLVFYEELPHIPFWMIG